MNQNKIAFIICTNNQLYFNECQYYIQNLILPENMELGVIGISEAPSMCAGYNAEMESSKSELQFGEKKRTIFFEIVQTALKHIVIKS